MRGNKDDEEGQMTRKGDFICCEFEEKISGNASNKAQARFVFQFIYKCIWFIL